MTAEIQQKELYAKLWAIANDLRGTMEAGDFKDYILGLIFYKYLSNKVLHTVENDFLVNDNITMKEAWDDEDYRDDIIEELKDEFGYYIAPDNLFSTMIEKINSGEFDIEMLQRALNEISASTQGLDSNEDFDGLFSDMDLGNNKLGKTVEARSSLIGKVMERIDEMEILFDDSKIDMLGDAYEYLIGQFAVNSGKKAGEFYTPRQVSVILAKIVTANNKEIKKLYDPTCGSGSLLLTVHKEADKVANTYGQEKISTTYNLARMNMLLHGLKYNEFEMKNYDTLTNPQHLHLKFDAIVANPPYSLKWEPNKEMELDERFSDFGKLAPKGQADYAFVQHMIFQLSENGTMAVVLPHGVLFRSNAEKVIRTYLIEKNYLDAVIGLPSNIFYATSIPTCILVFKKCRENEDVIFIDASNDFDKQKNQNRLSEDHIKEIVDTYIKREEKDKYSHRASIDEIKQNDFNLNIPRYVDTFEEEEEIDIEQVLKDIDRIKSEIADLDEAIKIDISKLVKTDIE